ncbi:MAG: hypothetical protein ACXABO_04930 [Promethearchaeota archaeon]|jgi:hypothetical protein
MEVSLRYHEVLEEDLVMELEWLKEEFELLFASIIENHTEMDKSIANDILDHILENTDLNGNNVLLDLLDETLEIIEGKYSALFN